MIDPGRAVEVLGEAGVSLFTGVPDSLLKEINTVIEATLPPATHVPAPNEGAAVGVAAGHYLATGEIAVVYLQNSGLGNAVNPLASLASGDIYGIPMVLLVGWRGQPGVPDEPQHRHQGRVTEEMLTLLDVPVVHLEADTEDWELRLSTAVGEAHLRQGPVAVLVSAGTFSSSKVPVTPGGEGLQRAEAMETVLETLAPETLYVATTGYTARELAALRERRGERDDHDFLAVGSMGHAGAIALGLAHSSPDTKVVCLDGDGSLVMHLGSLAMIGRTSPVNFGQVVFNNKMHESVGGQATVLDRTSIVAIALDCGYTSASRCATTDELVGLLRNAEGTAGPWLIEVTVRPGTLEGLPRPTDLIERKDRLRSLLGDD